MPTLISRVWIALLLAGCTYVNQPLNESTVPLERRQLNHTRAALGADVPSVASTGPVIRPLPPGAADLPRDADGFFVGISLSGGGSRSANFSAACMFQLQRLGILQKVDYISAVSGGSLPAAYYCLNDDSKWNPGNLQEKLTHPFATDLILTMIQPWNAVWLQVSDWDTSDILAAEFQRELFSKGLRGQTFADLRSDRPRLLINSTDLQSGRRFIFCNESFDDINSDLEHFPIAYAVAASSAVPVLLHHVTLRDFSTIYKQYRHFIDGGVVDNLGVLTLVDVYEAQNAAAAARKQPPPYPNGGVLIVVDARTNFDAQLSDKGDLSFLEKLKYGFGLTTTSMLARAGSATMADLIVRHAPDNTTAAEIRKQIQQLEHTGYLETKDREGRPVRIIHVALSRLKDLSSVPFPSFSESVNSIATYFNIEPSEAHRLYQAAELLIKEQHEQVLREIVGQLDAATRPAHP